MTTPNKNANLSKLVKPQKCSSTCIPACLTCQEFEERGRTDGKGFCTLNMSDPTEVDGFDWCKKFKCINMKDD